MSEALEEALQDLYAAEYAHNRGRSTMALSYVREARQALEAHLREEETPA